MNACGREFPTLAVLMKLSEPTPLEAADLEVLSRRGPDFVEKADLGYLVLDQRFITQEQAAPVLEAFGMRELQRDRHLILYRRGGGTGTVTRNSWQFLPPLDGRVRG